jgi:hypothetical protein
MIPVLPNHPFTNPPMLTRNFDQLSKEVKHHVECDAIRRGSYWDGSRGCFIGCLSHSGDTAKVQDTYGLPIMLQRIAESIFESLPLKEAQAFFAALPTAVSCDNKDLSRFGWQFLASELRSLPPQPAEIAAVIEPVIVGMDLLAAGQEWSAAYAYAATTKSARAAARAAAAAYAAATTTDTAAAAAYAAYAAATTTDTTDTAAAAAAAYAAATEHDTAAAAAYAAAAAAYAAAAADTAAAAARLRQRDLFLRLIAEAPIVPLPITP